MNVRRIDGRADEWMIRMHISDCYDGYLAEDIPQRLLLALAYGFSPSTIRILTIARIDDFAGTPFGAHEVSPTAAVFEF
jgi:hypothetical protein